MPTAPADELYPSSLSAMSLAQLETEQTGICDDPDNLSTGVRWTNMSRTNAIAAEMISRLASGDGQTLITFRRINRSANKFIKESGKIFRYAKRAYSPPEST